MILLHAILLALSLLHPRGVALGDSITERSGWVRTYDPALTNEGRAGWTSAQLLDRVQSDPSLRAEIAMVATRPPHSGIQW